MSERSTIEWTEATWNPIAGCSLVSPGCTNCYAMRRVAPRLSANPATPHYAGTVQSSKGGPVWTGKIGIAADAVLLKPLKWRRPRMIFVNSTSDLFHPDVPEAVIDRVFAVMALCPQHTFQVLTKRPERMREYLSSPATTDRVMLAGLRLIETGKSPKARELEGWRPHPWPLPNVWLGTSVEDQQRADERIPHLLATPAAVRFISAEPLLGPIDVTGISYGGGVVVHALRGRRIDVFDDSWGEREEYYAKLDWVIVGGESGSGARPMHPDWARSLRDQCAAAGVPFFCKQWGEWAPGHWSFDISDHVHFFPDDEGMRAIPMASKPHDRERWWDADEIPEGTGCYRVGAKRAGRRLDGIEHSAMPDRARGKSEAAE